MAESSITIVESQGYFIESSSGKIGYAVDKFRADRKSKYLKKEDKKVGISNSEITISEISGFLIRCSASDYEAFLPTLDLAKRKAKILELKKGKDGDTVSKDSLVIIGYRMKKAREELCSMSQGKAAKLLGISQKKLCQFEHCTDGLIPDIKIIRGAATIYKVAADYLLGLSDDFETDIDIKNDRQIGAWIYDQLEHNTIEQMNVMRVIHGKIITIGTVANELIKYASVIKSSLDKVRDINPDFDNDIKSGASLVRVVDDFAMESGSINSQLRRFNCFRDVAKKSTGVNVDIFKIDGGN